MQKFVHPKVSPSICPLREKYHCKSVQKSVQSYSKCSFWTLRQLSSWFLMRVVSSRMTLPPSALQNGSRLALTCVLGDQITRGQNASSLIPCDRISYIMPSGERLSCTRLLCQCSAAFIFQAEISHASDLMYHYKLLEKF